MDFYINSYLKAYLFYYNKENKQTIVWVSIPWFSPRELSPTNTFFY